LLRKRELIESLNDPLKNVLPIEPTRHRQRCLESARSDFGEPADERSIRYDLTTTP
jgi:hypothetical protein